MKPIRHCALPALLLLLSACKPQAAAPPPEVPARPLLSASRDEAHEARMHDAERALQRLAARLQRDKVYADACNAFVLEGDADDGSRSFDIAVRERHGDGCPGDPQSSPVRDRFRIARDGAIRWYDPIEGDFVDYAQRTQRLEALDGPGT